MEAQDVLTFILIVIFGLIGAWLHETFNDIGELLAILLVFPPMVYYIASEIKIKRSRGERERL